MPSAAPEARRVERDGVVPAAESFGDPADPAILLIMGAMASAVWWPSPGTRTDRMAS